MQKQELPSSFNNDIMISSSGSYLKFSLMILN